MYGDNVHLDKRGNIVGKKEQEAMEERLGLVIGVVIISLIVTVFAGNARGADFLTILAMIGIIGVMGFIAIFLVAKLPRVAEAIGVLIAFTLFIGIMIVVLNLVVMIVGFFVFSLLALLITAISYK